MDKIFKAKRLDNGEWVEFDIIDVLLGDESIYHLDFKTICQYTGLNDSEGNKIFEGDVIYLGNESFKFGAAIEFKEGSFGVEMDMGFIELHNFLDIKIIGNIHDKDLG